MVDENIANYPMGYPTAYPNIENLSPHQLYAGSIEKLTNPLREIRKMELTFKGLRETEEGKLEKIGEPLMNDVGILTISGMVQSIVSQLTVLSDVNDREISALMLDSSDAIIRTLMINKQKFGISDDPTARDRVLNISTNMLFIALKRAQGGGDRRFWKGSQQDIRHEVFNQTSGGGFLSKLNPFKR